MCAEDSGSASCFSTHLEVHAARPDELRHLVELREVARLAAALHLNDFRWPRGKIAVGGRWHLECLPFRSGAMGLNRRAQTFVRMSFLPKPLFSVVHDEVQGAQVEPDGEAPWPVVDIQAASDARRIAHCFVDRVEQRGRQGKCPRQVDTSKVDSPRKGR